MEYVSSQPLAAGTTTAKPNRHIDGGILRNATSVQTPQLMLIIIQEYETQVQPRQEVMNRLMAVSAGPSYLTLLGFPHS